MPLASRYVALCCALLGAAGAHAAAQQPQDAHADARAQFVQAYAAAAAGAPTGGDPESLRAYPLYPYLEGARMRAVLAAATGGALPVDAEAAAFIARHAGEPVARGLRDALLASLARREQWGAYLDHHDDADATPAQRCHVFAARIALKQEAGLQEAVAQAWQTSPASVPECDAAFTWLRARGALTTELIEARTRLALKEGNTTLARTLMQELPTQSAAPLKLWTELIEDARNALDALLAVPGRAVERDALFDGWSRLARKSPDAARERYALIEEAFRFTPEDASPFARTLALGLAWSRSAQALPFFELVAPADVDDVAAEWHARAALWAGDWERAERAIGAMPEALRTQSRWRYWEARVAEALHGLDAARDAYAGVVTTDNFYAGLAAARLHAPFAPHPQPLARDDTLLATLAAEPGIVRARELHFAGLEPLAEVEWWDAQSRLDETARRQSVHVAAGWGWHEKAIVTAARLRFFEDYALLYPRPFDPEVAAAAKAAKLPPALVYATLRQESLYRADAVSTAGALGLMQLRPETARKVAKQVRRPPPSRQDLFDPTVNIELGAMELRAMVDHLRSLPVGLAAYNAGPNAARRWLPTKAVPMDVWMENIPYNETRTYVQRVLWHSVVFAWIASGEPQDTSAWTGTIHPDGALHPRDG
jgi:soluble lytic murein transglycosylase